MVDPGWGIWGKCPPPSRNCIQDRDTFTYEAINRILFYITDVIYLVKDN